MARDHLVCTPASIPLHLLNVCATLPPNGRPNLHRSGPLSQSAWLRRGPPGWLEQLAEEPLTHQRGMHRKPVNLEQPNTLSAQLAQLDPLAVGLDPALPERNTHRLGWSLFEEQELRQRGIVIPPGPYRRMRRFLDGMRRTNTVAYACLFANISRRQYNRWLHQYPVFAEALAEAREDFQDNLKLRLLRDAEKGDHVALRLILRGEFPDLYGTPRIRKKDKLTQEELNEALWAAAEREPPNVR